MRIGDKAFTAIDDKIIAIFFVGGPDSGRIRAPGRLGNRRCRQAFTFGQSGQIFLFEFITPEFHNRLNSQSKDLEHHGRGHRNAADFLKGNHTCRIPQPQPAIFFRNGQGHHFGCPQGFDDFIADLACFFHRIHVRRHAGFCKLARGFSEHFLFFGKCKINHG